MLRKDLSPKPVYDALRKLIHEEWHTRAEGLTDSGGRFNFTGFRGAYNVTAAAGGKTVAAECALPRRGKRAEIVVRMM